MDYKTAKKALQALEDHKKDFIHGMALEAIEELEEKLSAVCQKGRFRDDYGDLGIVEGLTLTVEASDYDSCTVVQIVKAPHLEAVRECINQRFAEDDNGAGGMGADCTGKEFFYRGESTVLQDGYLYAITQRISRDV